MRAGWTRFASPPTAIRSEVATVKLTVATFSVLVTGMAVFALWRSDVLDSVVGAPDRPAEKVTGTGDTSTEARAARVSVRSSKAGVPPRFQLPEARTPVFRRPFWRELAGTTNAQDQSSRLAHHIGLDPDQSAMLADIFVTLSQLAATAGEQNDEELAESVEREAKRVLVALSDSDEQSREITEMFGNSVEN
jgi:hypothetical protein